MIGVFGGTFDPVHYGHLRSALEIQQRLAMQEVRLVPCAIPPHRNIPVAPVTERLAMLRLALSGQAGLVLDERELHRDGPSYSIDTLQSFRKELADVPLCLIVGMDAFRGFAEWHRWRELSEYAHVIVMTRPGWDVPAEGEIGDYVAERVVDDAGRLRGQLSGHVFFQEVTGLDISASAIRSICSAGESPRYLLPDSVLEHISRENLYQ